MTREDAFYYKILLMSGFSAGYDQWLDHHLEAEDPLSDVVLALACCGSDVNKTFAVLHNYCGSLPVDEAALCNRLRLFLKEAYDSNRMSKAEIAAAMYRFANHVGDPGDFDITIWGSMYYMKYYWDLAEDTILSWEIFDQAFFSYLNHGTPVDPTDIWNRRGN